MNSRHIYNHQFIITSESETHGGAAASGSAGAGRLLCVHLCSHMPLLGEIVFGLLLRLHTHHVCHYIIRWLCDPDMQQRRQCLQLRFKRKLLQCEEMRSR